MGRATDRAVRAYLARRARLARSPRGVSARSAYVTDRAGQIVTARNGVPVTGR